MTKKICIAGSEYVRLPLSHTLSNIRNTKVLDITNELEDYDINIDVYEPWINKKDKKYYPYNFINNPLENNIQYKAIIVTVGHDSFKTITQQEIKNISQGESIICDMKGILNDSSWKL